MWMSRVPLLVHAHHFGISSLLYVSLKKVLRMVVSWLWHNWARALLIYSHFHSGLRASPSAWWVISAAKDGKQIMEEKPLVEFTWNLVQKGFFKKKKPWFLLLFATCCKCWWLLWAGPALEVSILIMKMNVNEDLDHQWYFLVKRDRCHCSLVVCNN